MRLEREVVWSREYRSDEPETTTIRLSARTKKQLRVLLLKRRAASCIQTRHWRRGGHHPPAFGEAAARCSCSAVLMPRLLLLLAPKRVTTWELPRFQSRASRSSATSAGKEQQATPSYSLFSVSREGGRPSLQGGWPHPHGSSSRHTGLVQKLSRL
ncbi:hypothetical protein NDU88_006329 [Pleurodeles waltl]|uniref:Uncharacterized protein n=1 Tax=Pleurodeles waltl TaxID=8319 RepID=A0AAV7QN97_PLEWA|nr:hypothetical protein NDU88_006329 [Pleurodeles waltl]